MCSKELGCGLCRLCIEVGTCESSGVQVAFNMAGVEHECLAMCLVVVLFCHLGAFQNDEKKDIWRPCQASSITNWFGLFAVFHIQHTVCGCHVTTPVLLVVCVCAVRSNDVVVEELAHPPPGSQPLHFNRPFAASSWQQFTVLSKRWFTNYW